MESMNNQRMFKAVSKKMVKNLAAMLSRWNSIRALLQCRPCGSKRWHCLFWTWGLAGGSKWLQMDQRRSSRSSCSSRWCRRHQWFWQSRTDKDQYYYHQLKNSVPIVRIHQSVWSLFSKLFRLQLLSSPSSEGCRGSRQGSPVSSKYLWERSLIRFGSLLMSIS